MAIITQIINAKSVMFQKVQPAGQMLVMELIWLAGVVPLGIVAIQPASKGEEMGIVMPVSATLLIKWPTLLQDMFVLEVQR